MPQCFGYLERDVGGLFFGKDTEAPDTLLDILAFDQFKRAKMDLAPLVEAEFDAPDDMLVIEGRDDLGLALEPLHEGGRSERWRQNL